MALGQRRRGRTKAPVPKLQITAMMDMFTIIMIFLLVSFSSRPERMNLEDGMELPHSSAESDYRRDLRLILSTTALTLEGEVLGEFDGQAIVGLDPKNPTASPLFQKLKASREAADETAANDPPAADPGTTQVLADDPDADLPPLLFLCDKRLPFETINTVIKTAGMAGYPNLQLAVLQN